MTLWQSTSHFFIFEIGSTNFTFATIASELHGATMGEINNIHTLIKTQL